MMHTALGPFPFQVDDFSIPTAGKITWFLSHAHADHLNGLHANWDFGHIYCTHITASVVAHKLSIPYSRFHILSLDTPTRISLRDTSPAPAPAPAPADPATILTRHHHDPHFVVTAIDANHCLGAVMFLFQGEFGVVLHTGDFRWTYDGTTPRTTTRGRPPFTLKSPQSADGISHETERDQIFHDYRQDTGQGRLKMEQSDDDNMHEEDYPNSGLISCLRNITVDILFLDNTYCHPQFDSFFSLQDAFHDILRVIRDFPQHRILLGLDSLGKEELLIKLSLHFHCRIRVNGERYHILRLILDEDILHACFTTKRHEDTFLEAVMWKSISLASLKRMKDNGNPTVGIIVSGFQARCPLRRRCTADAPQHQHSTSADPLDDVIPLVHQTRYSLHSSYSELYAFVQLVKPRYVFGISSSETELNPATHFRSLLRDPGPGSWSVPVPSFRSFSKLESGSKSKSESGSESQLNPHCTRTADVYSLSSAFDRWIQGRFANNGDGQANEWLESVSQPKPELKGITTLGRASSSGHDRNHNNMNRDRSSGGEFSTVELMVSQYIMKQPDRGGHMEPPGISKVQSFVGRHRRRHRWFKVDMFSGTHMRGARLKYAATTTVTTTTGTATVPALTTTSGCDATNHRHMQVVVSKSGSGFGSMSSSLSHHESVNLVMHAETSVDVSVDVSGLDALLCASESD